jgi:single-stranded-DNA-specific exonuclease
MFTKFGGHAAAGGFTFATAKEADLRAALTDVAASIRQEKPEIWESQIVFDCELPPELATLSLTEELDGLKPFGHGFEEPRFALKAEITGTRFYNCKETGEPRHTCVMIRAGASARPQKLMFFNEVHEELKDASEATFVVSAGRSTFAGETTLTLYGHDFDLGAVSV